MFNRNNHRASHSQSHKVSGHIPPRDASTPQHAGPLPAQPDSHKERGRS